MWSTDFMDYSLCDSLISGAKKEETQRVESLLVAEKGFEPMTFGL